jgi:hypothetical protein
MWQCQPERWAYARATGHVAKTQEAYLRRLLFRNRSTEFGLQHEFASIRSVTQYQKSVPLMTEDRYQEWIARIAGGQLRVLTEEPVLMFQPTSGTTGGRRLVPYTRSLQREYQRLVGAWIGDLYAGLPAICRGRAYWSVTPAMTDCERTRGGLRIGFDDDTEYLGMVQRWMARRVLAVSPEIAKENDIDRFRYRTLRALLAAEDLALISIWSPTFLLSLLDGLETLGPRIVRDLRHGSSSGIPWNERPRPSKLHRARADAIERILDRRGQEAWQCKRLWPHLTCLSCWMDGASALPARQLERSCDGVFMQPKGLLATEAAVSFPILGQSGCGLAIRSHFFEFQRDTAPDLPPLLAHELKWGEYYRIVVTTGGGLYRYPLHDTVEVVGWLRTCPLLRFMGRSNQTSDLVGEKLSEAFVQGCVNRALVDQARAAVTFAMLVPCQVAADQPWGASHYELRLEWEEGNLDLTALQEDLEQQLQSNPHYRYARQLGQLGPVRIVRLPGPPGTAWLSYENQLRQRGLSIGAIKPRGLMPLSP